MDLEYDPRTDLYELLGIADTASDAEIRRAHRAAIRELDGDPRTGPADRAAVTTARDALVAPAVRRRYDEQRDLHWCRRARALDELRDHREAGATPTSPAGAIATRQLEWELSTSRGAPVVTTLAAAQLAEAVSSGEFKDAVGMFGASLLAGRLLDPGAAGDPAARAALRRLAATAQAHRLGQTVLEILGELRRSAAGSRRRRRHARRARVA